jgi:hypothetical protein
MLGKKPESNGSCPGCEMAKLLIDVLMKSNSDLHDKLTRIHGVGLKEAEKFLADRSERLLERIEELETEKGYVPPSAVDGSPSPELETEV